MANAVKSADFEWKIFVLTLLLRIKANYVGNFKILGHAVAYIVG
jgi:hypothetical protein